MHLIARYNWIVKLKKLYLSIDTACEWHRMENVKDNNRASKALPTTIHICAPAQPTD